MALWGDGQQVYKSIDGGHTWKALPDIKGNCKIWVPIHVPVQILYLSLSYPTAISYLYTDKVVLDITDSASVVCLEKEKKTSLW